MFKPGDIITWDTPAPDGESPIWIFEKMLAGDRMLGWLRKTRRGAFLYKNSPYNTDKQNCILEMENADWVIMTEKHFSPEIIAKAKEIL